MNAGRMKIIWFLLVGICFAKAQVKLPDAPDTGTPVQEEPEPLIPDALMTTVPEVPQPANPNESVNEPSEPVPPFPEVPDLVEEPQIPTPRSMTEAPPFPDDTSTRLPPVNGGWSNWDAYRPCTKKCGGGTMTSKRFCNSPKPGFNGQPCIGEDTKTVSCNTLPCPKACSDQDPRWCPFMVATLGPCKSIFLKSRCRKSCGLCKRVLPKNVDVINDEQCGFRGKSRVVGGKAATAGAWPWQVRLSYWKEPIFGGTLINKQWVLTSSHAFGNEKNNIPPKYFRVVLGDLDRDVTEAYETVRNVSKILRHPQFKKRYGVNDIALVKLAQPVEINNLVRPICLREEKAENYVGKNCFITGWGKKADRDYATKLQGAEVPIVDRRTCAKAMGNFEKRLTSNMICAGKKDGGVDACQGDGGGPIVCYRNDEGQFEQVGITSWGAGCADAQRYGVYTRVNNYIDWIKETIIANS
eukprot:Seg3591.1 transcript_id=Seg3591.1/GoldUCD/mRNA.D3Y31 product="Serine protease 30" protein_id=Seg3591.1/GoldUCD/D3Y31